MNSRYCITLQLRMVWGEGHSPPVGPSLHCRLTSCTIDIWLLWASDTVEGALSQAASHYSGMYCKMRKSLSTSRES